MNMFNCRGHCLPLYFLSHHTVSPSPKGKDLDPFLPRITRPRVLAARLPTASRSVSTPPPLRRRSGEAPPRWTPPTAARAPGVALLPAPSRTSSRTSALAAPPSSAPSPTVRARAPANPTCCRRVSELHTLTVDSHLSSQTSRSSTRSAIQVSSQSPFSARSLLFFCLRFDLGTC
jgi:hypothetical protein